MFKCNNRDDLNRVLNGRVGPQIYAFIIDRAKGYTKIGDTYRPLFSRLDEWEKIFHCEIVPIYRESAVIDGKTYYRDISVHKYLKHNNKMQLTKDESNKLGLPHYSQEFFKDIITPDNIDAARKDIVDKYKSGDFTYYDYYNLINEKGHKEKDSFTAREDQKNAIDSFKKAIESGEKRLLMYAVMRFGKSYTAMSCAKQIDNCKFVLIVSAKKDVIGEWENAVQNHVDFEDFDFLTVANLKNDYDLISKSIDNNRKVVVCTTLQDLQSKKIKDRYKQLFKKPIDLMIIDEAHYGAGCDIQGAIVQKANLGTEEENAEDFGVDIEKINALIESKELNVKYQLFLSGTPYTILAQKEFSEKQIICAVRYTDIIRKKKEIAESISTDDSKQEWENEYYSFPEMIRFGFNLDDDDVQEIDGLKKYNWSGELSELFRIDEESKKTNKPQFVHRQDVLDLLMAIDGSTKYSNILDFLNFDAVKEDRLCRHIVICLNQKAMCNALEDLLTEESDNFINLKTTGETPKYKIINISGDRKKYKIDNIRKTIANCEEKGQKTISLTVRRMMTGVTVKEWDTMLMFKSTKSAEEYDQATFRLQSGFTKKIYKDNTNEDDYIVENLKPQTLVVDFDLNRMFSIQEKSSSLNGFKTGNDIEDKSIQGKMADDLQYAPIITMNKNQIQQVEATDIIKAITNYTKNKSIVEEVNCVNYQELDIENDDELLELILRQNELTVKNSQFKMRAFEGKNSKQENRKLKAFLEGIRKKKAEKRKLTKEEKKIEDGLANKKKMLIAKILFFTFLSKDDIKYHNDLVEKIESSEDNKRIAKDLGLSKADLELTIKRLSTISLGKLDERIAKANILSLDEEIEGVDKNLAALAEFNRFSDSEIVTPNKICQDMIKLLPKEQLIEAIKKGKKILDIASKQGEFAFAVFNELKSEFANDIDLLKNAIYSIPTSSIAYEFTRRMYEVLDLNMNNISEKLTSYSLLKYKKRDKKGKETKELDYDKICEVIRNEFKKEGETEMIQFDAVVGNPPYNIMDGGYGVSATPVYNFFVEAAKKIHPNYVSMIMPSRWFSGGKYLDEFRATMLSEKKLQTIVDFNNFRDVFPGVDLAGGVCYFLWNKGYKGDCLVVNASEEMKDPVMRNLNEYDVFIRSNQAIGIVKKVLANVSASSTLTSIVSARKPFGLPTNYKPQDEGIPCWFIKKIGLKYANAADIDNSKGYLNKWKFLVPKSPIAGQTDFSKPVGFYYKGNTIIAKPGECCTESYIVAGAFDTEEETIAYRSYIFTKIVRFLLLQTVVSQDVTQKNFCFIPNLGRYKGEYTDEQLCNMWNISDVEWKYIDSKIHNYDKNN